MTSFHYSQDRTAREEKIKEIGIGKPFATFTVDRHHKNGAELHTITTTGIIVIHNARTHKLITKLIARPQQIKRYFTENTKEIAQIVRLAEYHEKLGYNMI